MSETVFIGLGSNLQNPIKQIQTALKELEQIPQTQLVAHSSLYCSKPVGPQNQPDYTNAAAQLETKLLPTQLLDALQTIERTHHRIRRERWGPRTLDLDILLFGAQQIKTARLTIPHPHMHERKFVLQPLMEIAPNLRVLNLGQIAELLTQCTDEPIQRIQADFPESL